MCGAVEGAVGADEGARANGDGADVEEGAGSVDVKLCAESVEELRGWVVRGVMGVLRWE